MKIRRRLHKIKDSVQLYDEFFHPSRIQLVEKHLSPATAKKFRRLSKDDQALFINILITEGKLSW